MSNQRGTSVEYIIERCKRVGRPDLAQAIERGLASAFEIAVEMGWQKRRNVTGRGSENQAKARAWRLHKLGL